MAKPNTVFFLRGLNTFGDDQVHIGPLSLGPMSSGLKQSLSHLGVNLIGINGMGRKPLKDQANTALSHIEQHPLGRKPFHLLGHSAGGLVARALADICKQRKAQNSNIGAILSVTTLATPHQGSLYATRLVDKLKSPNFVLKNLKWIGYNPLNRIEDFSRITLEAVNIFNKEFPMPDIPHASLQFSLPWIKLPTIYRVGLKHIFQDSIIPETDGLVELSSQHWGQSLGHFELDHMAQLGYPMSILGRNQSRIIFEKMCQRLASFWQDVEQMP